MPEASLLAVEKAKFASFSVVCCSWGVFMWGFMWLLWEFRVLENLVVFVGVFLGCFY
jgi:hypothetical protein